MRSTLTRAMTLATILFTTLSAAADATGTLVYKSKTREFNVPIKFAYLVKGPDAMDPKVIVRRLIVSATDLTATIQKCTTMSCADGTGADAMMVDIGAGPRLNYWLNLNDGLVQYSGTADPKSLTATTDTPAKLAGKLVFDGSGAGGPKVSIDFDASLLKEFTRAR
jgi:hypothetical protein